MNRKRLMLIGVLALTIAAFISFAVYRVLKLTVVSAKGNSRQIVVAALDVPVGSMLEAKDLKMVEFPANTLPDGTFTNLTDVVGRGVIVSLAKNEPVLTTKVAAQNGGAGLPAMIPPGMRAVSVKVNDVVAVAGFAVPGTRVDVLLTGNPNKLNDPSTVTTTTVLQNVQVLAAGQKLQKNGEGEPVSVPVITLLVSPEDAQKLTLASSEGRIQLSLRNPLDVDSQHPTALLNGTLYGATKPPAPVHRAAAKKAEVIPPPVAVYAVEMIRGDKRDVAKF